jgi:hypothetical protein
MSLTEEVIDGVLEADGTLRLSHQPNVSPGLVRVTVTSKLQRSQHSLADAIREIAAGQRARGYSGRTAEELSADVELQAEEDEERNRELESARKAGGPGVP